PGILKGDPRPGILKGDPRRTFDFDDLARIHRRDRRSDDTPRIERAGSAVGLAPDREVSATREQRRRGRHRENRISNMHWPSLSLESSDVPPCDAARLAGAGE